MCMLRNIILVLIVIYFYKVYKSKTENLELPILGGSSNFNINFKPHTEAPPTFAIYYNNPSGILKGNSLWLCYGENINPNNFTNFRSFKRLSYGYSAQLFNLLNYINSGIDTVFEIIKKWTALSPNTQEFKEYAKIIGFRLNEKINTLDKLKNFSANQCFAESGLYANPAFFRYIFDKSFENVKICNPNLTRFF